MKKISLMAGALLVAAPVLALVPGCGGGNGGIVTPTSTPLPTVTPLPTETGTPNATTTGTPNATTTGTPDATPTRTPIVTPTPTATNFPTPTPVPTNTPIVTPTPIPSGAVKANLTFTASSDSNFKNFPLTSAGFNLRTYDGSNTLQFEAQSGSVNLESVTLSGELRSAGQGNGYGAGSAGAETIQIRNDVVENNSSKSRLYRLQSGTITVTKLSASNATISFNNAVFAPPANSGGGTGTVTVKGTINGPYTTNQPF